MSKLSFTGAGALGLALAACHMQYSGHPKVPSDMVGTVPLIVANHSGNTLCAFVLVTPTSKLENWFDDYIFKVGEETTFNVKPGTYNLASTTCDQPYQTATIKPFQLSGPTYVSIGTDPATAPPGYTLASAPLLVPGLQQGEACRPSGASSDQPGYCCSQELDATTFTCK